MEEDVVSSVYPLLRQALRYREQIAQGRPISADAIQGVIGGQIPPAPRAGGDYLGLRYALVCWLDELFIVDCPLRESWSEQKLEANHYNTNDRAWKFWEQAKLAASRSDRPALEVFTLCLLLGFRGELREKPRELKETRSTLETQSGLSGRVQWKQEPAEMPVPPKDVDFLVAAGRLRYLLFGFVTVLAAAIVTAGYLAVRSLN